MTIDNKIFTWADLKAYANKLSENQLVQPVLWWGDERGGNVVRVDGLEEDYTDFSGECWEPVSAYEGEKDYDVYDGSSNILFKDTPILYVD